jgi:hypothetical protein
MKPRYYTGTDLLYICFTFNFRSIIIFNKWSNQCIMIEINVCFVSFDRKTLTYSSYFVHFFNINPNYTGTGLFYICFTFKFRSKIIFNKWSNQCIMIEINVCFVSFDRKTLTYSSYFVHFFNINPNYTGTDLFYICFTFKFRSKIIFNKWSNQCIMIEINVCFVTFDRKTLTYLSFFVHFFNLNPY